MHFVLTAKEKETANEITQYPMEMQVANSSILKAHQDTSGISVAFKMGKQCSCSITSSAGRQHQ